MPINEGHVVAMPLLVMPTSHRTERLADTLLREATSLLAMELKDPRLQGVTFTQAKLTKDLRLLRIYFLIVGHSEKELVMEGLNNSRGFIRRELARKIELRFVPEIEFFYDETDDLHKKAEELFEKIR